LGFGCNKLTGIRNSHRAEEIRCRIGFSTNQKLSGKLLFGKGGGRNLRSKIEKIMPNEAYGDEIYLGSLILAHH
jgi:hypothetical protein